MICIINNNLRTTLNVQRSEGFAHHCRIGCVPNGQHRAALYINDSIGMRINTVGFDGAGAAFIQCQCAVAVQGSRPNVFSIEVIGKFHVRIVKCQRSKDIE